MSRSLVPAHSAAFRRRRVLNWFPLGVAYALLYMGRYNLTVAKIALGRVMTKEDFGVIFGAGALVYGLSFLLNGPLTDKLGGRRGMLIAVGGALVMNLAMGLYVANLGQPGSDTTRLVLWFSILYAANMYFQSWGALSIIKVNAHWFHVNERGGFSGIFGTMISSGLFLAFTVNGWILAWAGTGSAVNAKWVFFAPAAFLAAIFVVELILLRDRPGLAGQADFATGDADDESDAPVRLSAIARRILTNPIILTVALIEFCTGVIRQGVMHWFPIYAQEVWVLPGQHMLRNGQWEAWYLVLAAFAITLLLFWLARRAPTPRRKGILYISGALVFLAPFVQGGWGGLLFIAGVVGGNVAGWVSDLFFQSRRAPAAGGLYALLAVAALGMYFVLGGTTAKVGWVSEDKEAQALGLDELRAGDEISAVEGTQVANWTDVAKTVACLPAACVGGAQFDSERCLCTRHPKQAAAAASAHQGPLLATVMREGQATTLRLRDTGSAMRAGDVRLLKAGPVLSLTPFWLGLVVILMSTCVIGAHGLLSGTATMDFGGRRGAATAAGLIDGMVYLGTAVQSFALGYLTTRDWSFWPLFLLPFSLVGFWLSTRIWHAKPKGK